MIFLNVLYQYGDPNDRELFSNFKLFHVGKKYWKYSTFDTEYSHISNNKSRKVSPSLRSPYWYKKLLYIIFQLSITHFSEQFQIVKNKIFIDTHVEFFNTVPFVRIGWTSFSVNQWSVGLQPYSLNLQRCETREWAAYVVQMYLGVVIQKESPNVPMFCQYWWSAEDVGSTFFVTVYMWN